MSVIDRKILNKIVEGYDQYKDVSGKAPYSVDDSKFTKGNNWMASDKKALNDQLLFTVFYNEGMKIYTLYIRSTDVDESEWSKVFIHIRAFMSSNGYTFDQSVFVSS